jgi:hypothetical protein
VYWRKEKRWFDGKVVEADEADKAEEAIVDREYPHKILYEDGEVEWCTFGSKRGQNVLVLAGGERKYIIVT